MGATSIVSFALTTRLILLGLNFMCYRTGLSYDVSSATESAFRQVNLGGLESLVRWDAVYFLGIAERGGYAYEQEFAFFPGLPLLMRIFYGVSGGSPLFCPLTH
jgi:hypothetical protein